MNVFLSSKEMNEYIQFIVCRYDQDFYQSIIKKNVYSIVAYSQDNKVVGVITALTKPRYLSEDCEGVLGFSLFGQEYLSYILTLCVTTPFRRVGIGKRQ